MVRFMNFKFQLKSDEEDKAHLQICDGEINDENWKNLKGQVQICDVKINDENWKNLKGHDEIENETGENLKDLENAEIDYENVDENIKGHLEIGDIVDEKDGGKGHECGETCGQEQECGERCGPMQWQEFGEGCGQV